MPWRAFAVAVSAWRRVRTSVTRPLCVPSVIDGVRSVIVSEELRTIEPMAWDFVVNFARDNDLQTVRPAEAEPVPPST